MIYKILSKISRNIRSFVLNRKFILDVEKAVLKRKEKKDVLFLVLNELMFAYLRLIYEKLKNDKRLRLWFCFYSKRDFKEQNLARIKKKYRMRTAPTLIAKYLNWDLVLYPFHGPHLRKTSKKILLEHGLGGGRIVKGVNTKYGPKSRDEEGNVRYDKIFAPDVQEKEIAQRRYPEYFSRIRVVGCLLVDELLAIASQRDAILKNLGLDANRKTIMTTSSWGHTSFAQNLGLEFVNKIPELLKNYNIIFSIHPNNFLPRLSKNINWQEIIDNLHYKNLFIVKDKQISLKFLPAADILLTDETSAGIYYLFLERPIVFYHNRNVQYEPGDLMPKMRNISHVIYDLRDFERHVQKAVTEFNPLKTKKLAAVACSHIGHAWERYEEEIYDTLALRKYSET